MKLVRHARGTSYVPDKMSSAVYIFLSRLICVLVLNIRFPCRSSRRHDYFQKRYDLVRFRNWSEAFRNPRTIGRGSRGQIKIFLPFRDCLVAMPSDNYMSLRATTSTALVQRVVKNQVCNAN